MTLETFFEKFDQFADAPDAVAKMRGLILRLAMQGKLSEPHKGDVPVIDLLRDVEKERAALGIKSARAAENGSSETEFFAIPSRWAWVQFGGLARHNAGKTLDKGRNCGELRDYITTSNLYWGFFQLDEVRQMPIEDEDLDRCTATKGDLLIVEGGEAGRAAVWCHDYDIAFQNHIHRARFFGGINPYFLQRYFETLNATGDINKFRKGVGISNMSGKALASIPVPVPPLAEQKRIVAKVDELMALCDRLEAQQQEREQQGRALARASLARFADAPTPANLDFLFHPSYAIPPADLRKSILTLAVQGKLVPFDNDGEEQKVGDHIEFQNGYAFKSEWLKPSGMRLCRNANVSHGLLDWRESAFVNDKVAKEFERFALSEGDIVLSLDRPLITTGLKVARVKKADLPCLLLQRVAKPVPKHDQLNLSYFLLWLNSSEFVDSIDPGRSNGVPHISTRQVQRLPFVLPPLAEQRRIVAKVDELMTLVDALETQLATARAAAANLLSAAVADLTTA